MIRQENAVSRSRKRDACDRCHEMKSRCHKLAGSTSCIRCERSGGQCHFSEALRAGRPKKRTTASLKQEPSPPSVEAPRSNEGNSPLDTQLETSSAIVENGMDMLNFASPLPDFFVSPRSMDEHMDTATSDSTFENWLSVNPSDTQIVCTNDHNTSLFSSSNQLESLTPEQFRMGSTGSSISSSSSGIQSSRRPESETNSINSQDSIVQQLLYLHSTLQRISTVYSNGGVLNWDNVWTPQTAAEETFLATDKLVAVMEELNQQSTPTTPHSGSPSRGSNQREIENPAKSQPGADSTSLLVLSCYICALEVYQAQVDSMKNQVNDIINESCNTARNGSSDSSTRASSLSSSANILPILNIGQFNLGMSPLRNLNLLLHLTQDMVERLQGAVQHWSSIGDSKDDELQILQHDDAGISDLAPHSDLSRTRKDSVLASSHEPKTRHAMSSVFDTVLVGVQSREKMLKASMQEVKSIMKAR